MVFPPFPTTQDPDVYAVSCRTSGGRMVRTKPIHCCFTAGLFLPCVIFVRSESVWVDPISHSTCSPECELPINLVVEEPGEYSLSLAAQMANGTTLNTKSFHFGSEYRLRVHSVSQGQTGPPVYTRPFRTAPSAVELLLLNKTKSSVAIGWEKAAGVISGFNIYIRNRTYDQCLSLTLREPRYYIFEGLSPGTKYNIAVQGTSGHRRSQPTTLILWTVPEMPQDVVLPEEIVTSASVSWNPPCGQVDGYELVFGLLSVDRGSWARVLVQGTGYEMRGLMPGPAGICGLRLLRVNSSWATVSWDATLSPFDSHRVTVINASTSRTLAVPREERVATVTRLTPGRRYDVSAERLRAGVAGRAAAMALTAFPTGVRGQRVLNVSPYAFSLRWRPWSGCVDAYRVIRLSPHRGRVTAYPTPNRYVQANVASVSPDTQFTVTASSSSSSNNSPAVSRMISTNETVAGPPASLEGERAGSTGIVLTWTMPSDVSFVLAYVIRYKEVCPYPDTDFTYVTAADVPEFLLNHFTPGSTYGIQVAAETSAGVGVFSKTLYMKTAEASPGLVTNLTAYAQNHTFVVVTWFLPRRINGLINKFAVKVKHARSSHIVRTLELNAEEIMAGALPHCNDAADILSRGTPSPASMTASAPSVTLSAVPPAASWSVPISVGVDELRPYATYLFEVSAFTSDGEGQVASTMVRMPESAPEDSPQNLSIWNMTSKSISIAWDPPTIVTGRFTYVIYLSGPTGYMYENLTAEQRFVLSGLYPYTRYTVAVRAKAAGEVGPEVASEVVTTAEAPSAVQELRAVAVDSISIRVSWSSPAQPNGVITQYRLQVLAVDTLLRNIIFTREPNGNDSGTYEFSTLPPGPRGNSERHRRSVNLAVTTSLPAFTATISDRPPLSGMTASGPPVSDGDSNTRGPPVDGPLTTPPVASKTSPASDNSDGASMSASAPISTAFVAYFATEAPSATSPPWLTQGSQATDATSDSSPMTATAGQPRPSTRGAAVTGQTSAGVSASPAGVLNVETVLPDLSTELSYIVTDLRPFTAYAFRVTASTVVGEGPAAQVEEKTSEQVPSAVIDVYYWNVTSTSVLVSWSPPLNPNGVIMHYTVYGLNLNTDRAFQQLTNSTSALLTDLDKYTRYKLRIAASTLVGESSLSEEDDIFIVTEEDEPDSPPEDVAAAETTPTTVTLTWSPPAKANGVIQRYEVLYENQTFSAVVNTSDPSATLTHLKPFSRYNVSVRAYTRLGHGNHTSDTVDLLSGEDVPGSAAYNLTYESVSPSEVNVTWQPPLVPNGVILRYSLLLWNATHSLDLPSATSSLYVGHLRKYARYRAAVQAHTRAGPGNYTSEPLNITTLEDVFRTTSRFSPRLSRKGESEVELEFGLLHFLLSLFSLYLSRACRSMLTPLHHRYLIRETGGTSRSAPEALNPPSQNSKRPLKTFFADRQAPDTPPQFLHSKKLSDYQVELSWQAPLEANSDILYYILRVWNETSETWQNVTGTSVVITVDSESKYNASVSSWTRLGDGGVVISISFTTSDAEPFDPPQNVTVSNVTASSVTLTWSPPTEPNGIIVQYTIHYSENGTLAMQTIPVSTLPTTGSPGSAHSYTLSGLVGGANYTLWMTSSTWQGDGGVHSVPFTLALPEDVPNDPVHNLTVKIFSSTVIIVSWDPPQEPNGRPHYLLTLQEAGVPPNGSPPLNRTIEETTTDTVFLFPNLRKYFPYVFTVTPATGAGPAYNYTSTTRLWTDDDIPSSPPILVSTSNLTATSISVVWQRPLEPNGEITEYSLTLLGPGASNMTKTPNTSLTLDELIPYTPYNLSIIAWTRKGSGPALQLALHTDEAGPMSPPRHLTIFNHTASSVWLSWEPSLEPNGVVTHYGFRVRDLTTHTDSYQNSSSAVPSEHLSGFRPHGSYEISVFTYTRVGHGDQYSSPVTFTTNESVSDMVGNLSCWGKSWDSIQLSWDRPANPNGQILFYQILVDSIARPVTHQAFVSDYTVTGLEPDQLYTLSVSAVNSAGLGDQMNCTTNTQAESVPGAPGFLAVSLVTATSVTLDWAPPSSMPGMLREYRLTVQLLAPGCQEPQTSPSPTRPTTATTAFTTTTTTAAGELAAGCTVDSQTVVSVNGSESTGGNHSFTLQSLAKHRAYRFQMAALTNAGVGEQTAWIRAHTLAGSPDAPPRNLAVESTSHSLQIRWDAPRIISGPTSYLVLVVPLEVAAANLSVVRAPGELKRVVVTNLTAFTLYSVTVTAFTGPLEDAARDGKTGQPAVVRTQEEEPKDPPKHVTLAEEVTRVNVTFTPPREPNGNISAYQVVVASRGYQQSPLVMNISGLNVIQNANFTVTVIIDGLKGGHNYSIRIAAVNGAGKSPFSRDVQITTGMRAPAKPTQKPQAVIGRGEVTVVTHRSITIHKPACFYSDNNGPIRHIQVIVAESVVKDGKILTNWKNAFFHQPAPYLTDGGFPSPPCVQERGMHRGTQHYTGNGLAISRHGPPMGRGVERAEDKYIIGEEDSCEEEEDTFCNGRLKPNTVYVYVQFLHLFKFRATNIQGQYTDSEYSDDVKTTVDGMLTRDEQIILGVLLSVFLAVLLIIIICASVRIHQRKNEGATYSPRQAEIIETKCKLDQLIAVADMELKDDKVNRYSSFFFRRKEIYVIQLLSYRKSLKPVNKKSFLQHVADLCANENTKFQEEFAELPKLLQDLGTSDADLPWNRSKNRFTNIKPYNNNRVKLLSEPGIPGSDYINASFISGYLCPNEFIATQGPLPGTVADFWRMVWETGTRTIAMLTQCYEKGRIRCHQYWPEDNKPLTVFGDIIITKLAENVFPDWTVRAIKVERHGDYMVVHHFNFTTWPEHGVPESSSTLIQFVKAVRADRHETTTIVVHCSAGVGRTGVFIALDHLIQHISDHDFVDVYGLVAELRSERMCMVQNLAQYMFLHQSTLALLDSKGNSQSIWFVNYSALEKMDSLDAMEGDVELEWEETTM
ncbi:Phosphatidylinositol phosphatase PTPRQ [Merluccius polli]|uniref:Phosphatidylinositol phosphatase PTPRQ n=1 Tax=Merluccius polli TaxID=89951 RepID=A0AA47N9V9_MERPO|nr:Phosphatidylinositol phosphatase PTPRQ [Merluccius polli]